MKSPREMLRGLLSPRKRNRGGSSDEGSSSPVPQCDDSASSAAAASAAATQQQQHPATNAALARTLGSMGDRTGLTLADVTGGAAAGTHEDGGDGDEVGPPMVKRAASDASTAPSAAGDTDAVIPMEEEEEEQPPPLRMTMTMSMSCRPLEEDPEWGLFLPFDSLEFSFVGGSIGVTRPIPEELAEVARPTLEMVLPVIQRITKVRRIVLSQGKSEVFLVDRPLAEKTEASQAASPVDDLRLADQMIRLALVGKPRSYSYWFFQFYVGADVCRLLGRSEEEAAAGAGAGAVENGVILNKIETMTGTRVLVAPHDPASWRRCFVLLGEEELITRALTLLSGAITQGAAPTREGVRQVMALHHDPNDPLLERDARLEEIRKELKEVHKLRMVEMQRDGNCLFRALSAFEYKTEARHRELRQLVCARLKEAPDAMEVTALVEGVTPEEYLRRMAKDGAWGGYTEVMAYAEALGRNVRLFVENDKIGIRPQDIEGHRGGPGAPLCVQLLLYKSHYWMLK